MVYDRFTNEYIDEKDMDPIAPPERYITDLHCLAHNAGEILVNAITKALNDSDPDPEVEPIEAVEEVREIEITIDYDRLEKSIYAAVYQAIKTVELDHLREG